MKADLLADILRRAETWPPEAQEEFARIALEFEAGLSGEYRPTAEELAGINRGLRAAAEGRFASEDEVEAVLAKFRHA
jgi:predicted transcriptional regulator